MLNFSGGPLENLRRRLKRPGAGHLPPRRPSKITPQQAELIRRYRPSDSGWLAFGLALALLHSLVIWSLLTLLALSELDEIVPGDRPWRWLLVPLVFLAAFYRGHWLEEREWPEFFNLYLLKWLALLLLARFSSYLWQPAALPRDWQAWSGNSALFFAPGFLALLFLLGWTMAAGEAQGRQLLRLYLRPQEVPVERGGSATGGLGWVARQPAYQALKNRLFLGGYLLGGCLIAAEVTGGADGSRARNLIVVFTALYIMLVLVMLSRLRLRYLRSTWQLAELAEPPGLARRWAAGLVGLVALVAVVAALLPHSTGLTLPNWQFFTPQDNQPNSQSAPPTQSTRPPPARPPDPPNVERVAIPGWVWPVLQILLILLVAFILWRLLRYAFGFNRGKLSFKWPRLAGLWQELNRWVRQLFRREKSNRAGFERERDRPGMGWLDRFRRETEPDDPRERVLFYYRQTLRQAARSGAPRQPPQTPAEFAAYLRARFESLPAAGPPDNPGPAGPPPPGPEDSDNLSRLYEAARFSLHPVTVEQAEEAGGRARRLRIALRQLRRPRRQP